MKWELLFCHSFWNDIKIQMPSVAMECEGSLYAEQLLAAPVYDRLPHYHFAQWERTWLNLPSEKTENSPGLLMSLSSAAPHAASWGPGSAVRPLTASFIARRWMTKNCIREVSKLPGQQMHMIEQRNKKPIRWFFFLPTPNR